MKFQREELIRSQKTHYTQTNNPIIILLEAYLEQNNIM